MEGCTWLYDLVLFFFDWPWLSSTSPPHQRLLTFFALSYKWPTTCPYLHLLASPPPPDDIKRLTDIVDRHLEWGTDIVDRHHVSLSSPSSQSSTPSWFDGGPALITNVEIRDINIIFIIYSIFYSLNLE